MARRFFICTSRREAQSYIHSNHWKNTGLPDLMAYTTAVAREGIKVEVIDMDCWPLIIHWEGSMGSGYLAGKVIDVPAKKKQSQRGLFDDDTGRDDRQN